MLHYIQRTVKILSAFQELILVLFRKQSTKTVIINILPEAVNS